MATRLTSYIAAGGFLLVTLGLLWLGNAGWALAVVYFGTLLAYVSASHRRRSEWLKRLKAERAGETFESFFDRLNRPDYDKRMVFQIYTAVWSMTELAQKDIALHPEDDLQRDLRIREEDCGDALFDAMRDPLRLVDTDFALMTNPHRFRRQTVGGLIDFFACHPKRNSAAARKASAEAMIEPPQTQAEPQAPQRNIA